MNCPHCHTALIEIPTLEALQVDVCPRAHGLWLDRGEINLLVENYRSLERAVRTAGGVAVQTEAMACPRCGASLESENASGTSVLACPSCRGWWLACGNLTRLHDAYRGGSVPIAIDEPSLYARAASKASDASPPKAPPRSLSSRYAGEMFFWIFIFGFGLALAALITMESLRHLSSTAHLSQPPDRLFFYLLLGLCGGVALFVYGFILDRRKRLIESIPTSPTRSLAVGLVEVVGNVRADGEELIGPFSGMTCVFFSYKVEERRGSGKNSRWVTIAKGTSDQPFYLRDSAGEVLIVPRDARLLLADDRTYRNDWLGSLPPEATAGLARLGISTDGWPGNKTLSCHESCLLSGETVYVLGTAQENPAASSASNNAGRLYIGRGPDGDFILSDRSEKELVRYLRRRVWGALYGGPALTLLSLFVLLKIYLGA